MPAYMDLPDGCAISACMAFDLGKAMAKKGEFESARLADFEFRQRARTFRLMAEALGEEPGALVGMIAKKDDEGILADLVASGRDAAELDALYRQCSDEARAQLIKERGDPTPHRLL